MIDIKVYLKKKKEKPQYGHERYKNLSEDKKQNLLEYRKNAGKYKKLFLIEIRVTFFISHLGLESLFGILNQQSSWVIRKFYILNLIRNHPRV